MPEDEGEYQNHLLTELCNRESLLGEEAEGGMKEASRQDPCDGFMQADQLEERDHLEAKHLDNLFF